MPTSSQPPTSQPPPSTPTPATSPPQILGYERAFRADADHIVELFSLTLTDGRGFHFIDSQSHAEAVRLGDIVYTPLSLKASGFRWEAESRPVRPRLDITSPPTALLQAAHARTLSRASLTRITTFRAELAPPAGEGGGSCFMPETWQASRILRLDDSHLQLEMMPLDGFEGRYLPARVMMRDFCQHHYRQWDAAKNQFDYSHATCPYMGSAYWDERGESTTNPGLDACSLRLESGCKKRFTTSLPFRGFPGVSR